MTSRKRIPGRVYSLVKAIDGDQITAQAYELLNKPGIDGKAGITSSKGQVYLAVDYGWKAKQK